MSPARTDVDALQREADTAPDPLTRSDALAALAEGRLLTGDEVGALVAMQDAIAAADEVAAFGKHADYAYALGLLRSRDPARTASAEDAWHDAIAHARLAEDAPRELAAWMRLARSAADHGRLDEAQASLDVGARLLDQVPAPDAIELLRSRARLAYARGMMLSDRVLLLAALGDLDDALARAEAAERPDLAVRIRVDRRLHAAWVPGQPSESLSDLVENVRAQGDLGLLGDLTLEQAASALRAKDRAGGLAAAEEARSQALQARDPVRYLLACLLIAEGREAQGDRPGVLGILLTAKQSLERLLGKEAGTPLLAVLRSLELRWGTEATQAALAAHQARVTRPG